MDAKITKKRLGHQLSYDWIKERVARHALSLHAWYFDMHSMSLLAYFPEKENFEPLAGHLPYQHS